MRDGMRYDRALRWLSRRELLDIACTATPDVRADFKILEKVSTA